MVCYRRRGHNEGDEPSFTQPRMYQMIDSKRTTRVLYAEALVGRGDITQEEADGIAKEFQTQLDAADVPADKGGGVVGVVFRGRRYDTGDRLSYLQAVVTIACEREDLGPDLRAWLADFVAGS